MAEIITDVTIAVNLNDNPNPDLSRWHYLGTNKFGKRICCNKVFEMPSGHWCMEYIIADQDWNLESWRLINFDSLKEKTGDWQHKYNPDWQIDAKQIKNSRLWLKMKQDMQKEALERLDESLEKKWQENMRSLHKHWEIVRQQKARYRTRRKNFD